MLAHGSKTLFLDYSEDGVGLTNSLDAITKFG